MRTLLLAALALVPAVPGQDPWIQNDLAAAQVKARETGKPIFAVFRCER